MVSPFDNEKLKLFARTLKNGKFPPTLKVDYYKGNPSFWISTGYEKSSGQPTYIRAGLEIKTAGMICQAIHWLADRPTNTEKVETISFDCKAGKEKELVAKVVVGKETNGKMFISVINVKDQNAPVIQFFFGPDFYHPAKVTHMSEDESAAVVSLLAAKSWADRSADYWNMYSLHNPYDRKNDPDNQNNSGGYGNKSGGYNNNRSNDNGGNGNNNSSDDGWWSE